MEQRGHLGMKLVKEAGSGGEGCLGMLGAGNVHKGPGKPTDVCES